MKLHEYNEMMRYLTTRPKYASGGRVHLKDGTDKKTWLDYIDVQASGSSGGKDQIHGAPKGFTSANEYYQAVISADIPISQKISLLGDLTKVKQRTRIEKDNQELFLDEGNYKNRNVGVGYNVGGEGLSGSVMRNLETGDDEFKLKFIKKFAEGGRIKAADGVAVKTLDPMFPEKNTDFMSEEFKPLDLPGAIIPPLAIGAGAKKLKDMFFSKNKGDDKKEIIPSDDKGSNVQPPENEPPNFDKIAQEFLIEKAVERLKTKEMNPEKRDARTKLARDLDLPVTRSGMFEIREGNFFNDRLQTLKDKGVNFDAYFSIPEIANLLGSKSSSGIQSYVQDKNIPFVKKGLYKIVKLSDFLNTYEGTKGRIDLAPPPDINTLARSDFLSEVGGNFYQRFKDMRRPKFLPPEVKEIYEKYNLGEIEGGHPFPVEFFTKKFGKNNTLQDDRQFDWIYRNKDKLFSKNNLVFQSKEVNKLFRNSIKDLKKLYKELGPYVDKYEGKGAVINQKDISKIEDINNEIMEIIGKSEFDAKKYIDKSDNKVDLERFKTGGLHGALFNTDTGEVSLYTGAGEGAGFEAISKEPIDVKLKLAGDYGDIINNIITNEGDKKIFTDYVTQKLLPKFQKGGPVYGKYSDQIKNIKLP